MHEVTSRPRVAGVTVGLFSIRTERQWGIGEIADLVPFAGLLEAAGLGLVQLLPLGEISGAETSPYASLSAFGIDPLYIAWDDVAELSPARLYDALGPDGRRTLAWARQQACVDYEAVRFLKGRALDAAWAVFRDEVLPRGLPRARAFEAFCRHEAHWLDGLAMFRALKDAASQSAWWAWPEALRDREPEALAAARVAHADAVGKHCYAQWVAHEQWRAVRSHYAARGLEIMGDLPFMVGGDSADVWCHRGQFREDTSVGVPGDQFDPEGQEWGLPPYHWEAMAGDGFQWLRRRARDAGLRYDRFRVDHLVGFYRTYQRRREALRDGAGRLLPGFFDPATEGAQRAHGEAVLGAMKAAAQAVGGDLIAEDLGAIPDFVRPSLAGLDVPGYKVLIWEKDGDRFRDPALYPRRSVACFGTHDTAPVRAWWCALDAHERRALCALPGLAPVADAMVDETRFTPAVHGGLLRLLAHAESELVLLLLQEVLGLDARVNVPGTVGPHNWTWRMPRTLDDTLAADDDRASLARVRAALADAAREPAPKRPR